MPKMIDSIKNTIEHTCSMASRATRTDKDLYLALMLMKDVICSSSEFNGKVYVYARENCWGRDFEQAFQHPCVNLNDLDKVRGHGQIHLIWLGPNDWNSKFSSTHIYEGELRQEIMLRNITVWHIEDWR